jgi:hypothetical protein
VPILLLRCDCVAAESELLRWPPHSGGRPGACPCSLSAQRRYVVCKEFFQYPVLHRRLAYIYAIEHRRLAGCIRPRACYRSHAVLHWPVWQVTAQVVQRSAAHTKCNRVFCTASCSLASCHVRLLVKQSGCPVRDIHTKRFSGICIWQPDKIAISSPNEVKANILLEA